VLSRWDLTGDVFGPDVGQPGSTTSFTMTTANETDITWTGYLLTLDSSSGGAFVEGSGASTDFREVLYPDAWTIEFRAPEAVPPGEIVTLEFKVHVPEKDVLLGLTLTHQPIPEPATVAFLGLGALVLLSIPRKRSRA
jgi:hypothetical protein